MMSDLIARALAPDNWPTFVFLTARIGGLAMVAPLWTMAPLTKQIRGAMIVVLAIALLPSAPRVALPAQVLDIPVPIATELIIGVVIGLSAAILVHGVGVAGQVISMQMGLAIAPALAPLPGYPDSGIGRIQTFMAVLIYLGIGGHLFLIRGLADSLQVLPPGAPIALTTGGLKVSILMGSLFSTALRTAAPIMVTLLITHASVAILNRAVPQIQTMLVAFPLLIGVGLLMLGLSLPVLGRTIGTWMQSLPSNLETVLGALRAGA